MSDNAEYGGCPCGCGALTINGRMAADHPHVDPGDGRSECETCGKFVWPVIHSCKGVPVTLAAMGRRTSSARTEADRD